jgi:hypothetical protein
VTDGQELISKVCRLCERKLESGQELFRGVCEECWIRLGNKGLTTCKKCGRPLETYEDVEHGLCKHCYTEPIFSEKEYWEAMDTMLSVKPEVKIINMTLRAGDVVEIMVGRNVTIRGIFKGWSNKFYAIQLETEDRDMIIPYKYIKMISKLRPKHKSEGEEQ